MLPLYCILPQHVEEYARIKYDHEMAISTVLKSVHFGFCSSNVFDILYYCWLVLLTTLLTASDAAMLITIPQSYVFCNKLIFSYQNLNIFPGKSISIDPLISSIGVCLKSLGSNGSTILATNQTSSSGQGEHYAGSELNYIVECNTTFLAFTGRLFNCIPHMLLICQS